MRERDLEISRKEHLALPHASFLFTLSFCYRP